MQDKLQELTQKLYNEGLEKGKLEAEQILQQAKKRADEIVAEAQKSAADIINGAEKQALELKAKAEGDIRSASMQTISQVRHSIEEAVKMECVDKPVAQAFNSPDFMQGIIQTIVSAFSPQSESSSLELILPESKKAELDGFIQSKLKAKFAEGLSVKYDKGVDSGFKISSKGSGYFIDFTQQAFQNMIAEYIRPKTRKLLFGE